MTPRGTIDRERIEAVCRRRNIKELVFSGSVLRDDFTADSDVDVLVELAPGHGLTLYDGLDIIEEIKGILGEPLTLFRRAACGRLA